MCALHVIINNNAMSAWGVLINDPCFPYIPPDFNINTIYTTQFIFCSGVHYLLLVSY